MSPVEKLSYTVAEACAATGIGRTRMFELLRTGQIRSKREGDRRLILRDELARYLTRLSDAA